MMGSSIGFGNHMGWTVSGCRTRSAFRISLVPAHCLAGFGNRGCWKFSPARDGTAPRLQNPISPDLHSADWLSGFRQPEVLDLFPDPTQDGTAAPVAEPDQPLVPSNDS